MPGEPVPTCGRRTLYIGCMPSLGAARLTQTEAYRAAARGAAEMGKAPSWDLVEYGKGPALLAAAFKTDDLPSEVVVDMRLASSRALAELLYDWADVVVSAIL
jgi:hypothetical protein